MSEVVAVGSPNYVSYVDHGLSREVSKHGALRPQKPQSLIGTGKGRVAAWAGGGGRGEDMNSSSARSDP